MTHDHDETGQTLDGVLRADGSARAVRFERCHATEPADLWAALTEPERLARWLDPVSGELRPGGRVTVHFDDGDAEMEVVSCEAPRALVVRWLHGDDASVVSVEVQPQDGGAARLVLDHTRLTATAAPAYAAGWHWHLDALAADLRGEQPASWDDAWDRLHAGYRTSASALA